MNQGRVAQESEYWNRLRAMVAMPMDATAVAVAIRALLVAVVFGRIDGGDRYFGARLAHDRIESAAQHDPEKQQKGCQSPSASKG